MSKYHIALSFAGEDREYVEEVAIYLRDSGVDVFYDLFEEENLWGKNLYEHLTSIYRDQALFTVMFVSEFYVKKLWGNLERKSAQARAFRESSEYILPAMFDTSAEVPGMLETTGYIDLNKKTPEKLADLIVRKLKKSGVALEGQHAYSENVKADVDYPVKAKGEIGKIIGKLKSYTWPTQNPAIVGIMSLDWSNVSADDAFVLGRNVYQCACGGENRAKEILDNLRKELASVPEQRAIDLVNGMFFEVYFNSEGEFRGSELKSRKFPGLLKIQSVKKFSPSVAFIRRALEPYKSELPFRPNTDPETLEIKVKVKKSDPPTIREMTANGVDIISADDDPSGNFWRLSYKGFTVKELKRQLSSEWGIPEQQIDIAITKGFSESDELRLQEGRSIIWPSP